MATVFLATDLRHDRQVALKVLNPDLALILGADRFLREIKTTAQLHHPHILPLFDSGSAGDLLFYVMPYVEGETLADRLDRDGAIPLDEARRIGGEVLGALAYAHGQGVIHRDIKPSNILLSKTTGHALVADFGIARAVSAAEDGLTKPGAPIGTPAYMAPEQARGQGVTPATDVYATGLVLYECLTGRRFPAPDEEEAVNWFTVPASVRGVLRRALCPNTSGRFPDATAFLTALLGERRSRGAWLPIAIAAAAVLATALVFVARTPEPVRVGDPRLVVFPFTVQGGGELDYLGSGMVDLLSAKLDGAGAWRLADPRAVLSFVSREFRSGAPDPETARRATQRLEASLFVLGTIIEVGSQVRLDATLYGMDPDAGALAQASVDGDRNEVLDLLDAMAAELLSGYGGVGDGRLTRTALVTTSSLPALKSYLRGVRLLRAGEFPAASTAFEDAIAADSGFALAWYQLSITADWLARPAFARRAGDEAVRFAARLPDRERQLLEALRTMRRGDADSAERQLRSIVGTHPDDIEAWSQLAELLFHFGPRQRRPLADSREAWHRVLRLEPDLAAAYVHLARIAAAERDVAALDTLSERALRLAPEGDRGLEMRTLRLLVDDDGDARAGLRTALREAPDDVIGEVWWSAVTFAWDRTIPRLVLEVATDARRSREVRSLGFKGLANLEASLGRWDAAAAAIDSLATVDSVRALAHGAYLALGRAVLGDTVPLTTYRDRLARQNWRNRPPTGARGVWFVANEPILEPIRHFLVGVGHALAGDDADALAEAAALDRMPPLEGAEALLADFGRTIRAAVAWRDGRTTDVLAALDLVDHVSYHDATASGFFGQAFARYLRGQALEAAGRLDDAARWYGTFRFTGSDDLVFLVPALLRQARVAEERGDAPAARTRYRAVLDRLDGADPTLAPLIADARERLAALEGE